MQRWRGTQKLPTINSKRQARILGKPATPGWLPALASANHMPPPLRWCLWMDPSARPATTSTRTSWSECWPRQGTSGCFCWRLRHMQCMRHMAQRPPLDAGNLQHAVFWCLLQSLGRRGCSAAAAAAAVVPQQCDLFLPSVT